MGYDGPTPEQLLLCFFIVMLVLAFGIPIAINVGYWLWTHHLVWVAN